MARRSKGELSQHPTKGYRVCVGTKQCDDGKIRPAVFWLGHDLEQARFKAISYRKVWDDPTRGEQLWTPEAIKDCNEMIALSLRAVRSVFERHEQQARMIEPARALAYPSSAPTGVTISNDGSTAKIVMLYAAIDSYVAAVQAKALSASYKRRIEETIDNLKQFRRDCPLASVDRVWLEQVTDEIKARPLSRKKNKTTGEREPIKPATVKTLLQHWRQTFDWLDRASDSDRFGRWEAPKRMGDLFECDLNKLRTKAERDRAADGPEQLTVSEIVKLYKAIDEDNDLHKIVMLMGLFTAQGQSELSCSRRDEIDLDTATFVHRRNKTGQQGKYWLPPELVTLLRKYFKATKTNDDNLCFFTRDGQPLVTENSDSVRQAFDDWRDRAEITRPGVTFYAFRRYLADRAARHGGDSLRDTALAHSAKTVGGKHYSNFRDFSALRLVSQELQRELTKAGMFEKKQQKKQQPKLMLSMETAAA